MALASNQVVLTAEGKDLTRAVGQMMHALSLYENAQIVTMTHARNWVTSFGRVTLVTVIEHDGERRI